VADNGALTAACDDPAMTGYVALSPEGKEEVEVARSPRRRMAFKGSFDTVSGRGTVAVRNISCTGAMIEGADMPPAGRDIILCAQGMEFFGTVVWSRGDRCGLRFDEALTADQVLELHRITPEQIRSQELNERARWLSSTHRFDY